LVANARRTFEKPKNAADAVRRISSDKNPCGTNMTTSAEMTTSMNSIAGAIRRNRLA